MDINHLKRNDVSTEEGLKFLKSTLTMDKMGPATLSDYLTEAYINEDENLSIQIWIIILNNLSNMFNVNEINECNIDHFSASCDAIGTIMAEFNNKNIVLSHFKNNKFWLRKTIVGLTAIQKIKIYAIDNLLNWKFNKKNYYLSMKQSLEEESQDIQIKVKGYIAYANKLLNLKYR